MIHPVINDTTTRAYCGPSAIAALTGLPISAVRGKIKRVFSARDRHHGRVRHGRPTPGGFRFDRAGRERPIRGMHNTHTLMTLERFGCKVIDERNLARLNQRMSLNQFCIDQEHRGDFLIVASNHYITFGNGMICDSLQKTPVPWREYRGMRGIGLKSRVTQWWRFDPERTIRVPVEPKERPAKPKPDRRVVKRDRALASLKEWQSKRKRADTAIKKLKRTLAYYERTLGPVA